MLGAFAPGDEQVFRHTWPIEQPGPVLMSEDWITYFTVLWQMTSKGSLKVETMAVLSDRHLCKSENIQLMARVIAAQPNMQVRFILLDHLKRAMSENDVGLQPKDFGLYGGSLLCVSEDERGHFTKDKHRIACFRRAFDIAWTTSSIALAGEFDVEPLTMSLDQFIALDAATTKDSDGHNDDDVRGSASDHLRQ